MLFHKSKQNIQSTAASISAHQVVRNAIRAGLNVTYDCPTIGDGNCWYRSVIQQMKRPEIRALLRPDLIFSDHGKLRLAVVDFIRQNQKSVIPIINFRTLYETEGNDLRIENNNRTWHEFLNHQERDTVFATELFIQATAVFLGIDICVTSETCTPNLPYIMLGRCWEHIVLPTLCSLEV